VPEELVLDGAAQTVIHFTAPLDCSWAPPF
jgi:hypothetical protein